MGLARWTLATCLLLVDSSDAFTTPSSIKKFGYRQISKSARFAATLTAPPSAVNSTEATTWECDSEINNCVEVPACDETQCRTGLDIRIHGQWYDLSGWRKSHPAGEHWIDWYDGRDATEVMDAFHSVKGREMYKRLPKSKKESIDLLQAIVEPDSETQIEFRKLREELEEDGWYQRDKVHEFKLLGMWSSLVVGAGLLAHSVPVLSSFMLGLSMTNAGWLGHDYIHGVDEFSTKMRNFAAASAGLAPTWWSDKHNKHHALTNEMGVDEDIATDPFLYQWAPAPEDDTPMRKVQHLVFPIPFSLLFLLWRFDSLTVTIDAVEQGRKGAKSELYSLIAHYFILLTVFPAQVWLPAVLMSGLVSALIVTPTHQSEDMFEDYQADWVTAQFRSTRNAVTTNPFSEWLWGGMQYQLEHHLFPSMPRSKYPKLKQRLQEFANKVGVEYRESGEFEILKMNWELYKRVAEADADPQAPLTKGRIDQVASIRSSGESSLLMTNQS
mmetsp:Transcript_34519/g.52978  ORF Transcript_34519/g.52978 Transcript_34519/m.52978 type:complete len:498 (+) Transcript_34519:34-1527(+)